MASFCGGFRCRVSGVRKYIHRSWNLNTETCALMLGIWYFAMLHYSTTPLLQETLASRKDHKGLLCGQLKARSSGPGFFYFIQLSVKGEKGRPNRDGICKRNGKRASQYRRALQISWSGRLDSNHRLLRPERSFLWNRMKNSGGEWKKKPQGLQKFIFW